MPVSALYLDSNAFISYLEGEPPDSALLKGLFDSLFARPGVGITSEITLGEVLAGSHKGGPQMKRAYLDLIVWSKTFALAPASRDVLYQSADLCIAHKKFVGRKLVLTDAIHLATAIQAKCQFFISADKNISPPEGMAKVDFDASAIDEVRKALA